MSTAFQAGAPNAFAVALMPFFFRLIANGEPAAAREVLFEIGRLMRVDDPSELPSGPMMRRLFQEKLAYSYLAEGDYERALGEYEGALGLARAAGDLRGALKVRGSVALCLSALGRRADALSMTEEIGAAADREGFRDVAQTADLNLGVLRTGVGSVTPYEVT